LASLSGDRETIRTQQRGAEGVTETGELAAGGALVHNHKALVYQTDHHKHTAHHRAHARQEGGKVLRLLGVLDAQLGKVVLEEHTCEGERARM
jgi:hypothetical protein